MSWWVWLLVGFAVGASLSITKHAARRSHARRGTLDFGTPEARAALSPSYEEPFVTAAGQRFIESEMGDGDAFERIFRPKP